MRRWWSNARRLSQAFSQGRNTGTILKVGSGVICAVSIPFWSTNKSTVDTPPVYAWGNNEHGLVAPDLANTPHLKYPTRISAFDGIHLIAVSASTKHAAAIDTSGNLYQWGAEFGVGDPICTLSGYELSKVVCTEEALILFSEKNQKCLVVSLRQGEPFTNQEHTQAGHTILPINITGLGKNEKIKSVAAGHDHFVILGNKGSVLTGELNERGNVFGQLGRGATLITKQAQDYTSKKPPSLEKFMSVFLSDGSTTEEQERAMEIKMFPNGNKIHKKFECHPVQFPGAYGGNDDGTFSAESMMVDQIACGDHHTLVRTKDGRVFGFGSNEMQQLGLGAYDGSLLIVANPKEIPNLTDVVTIAAGGQSSYFIRSTAEQSQILAAGAGLYGQLGNGSWQHTQGTPTIISRISNMTYYDERTNVAHPIKCRSLSVGSTHVAAIMNTYRPLSEATREHFEPKHGEDVFIWGGNKHFQLGIGGKHNNMSKPTTIVPFSMIKEATDDTSLSRKFASITKAIEQNPTNIANGANSIAATAATGEKEIAERLLKLTGPLLTNKEETIAFTGGQLQFLSDRSNNDTTKGPIQNIYCGPEITIIH